MHQNSIWKISLKEWLNTMRNSLYVILLLLVILPLSLNAGIINPEEYIMKPGDQFLLKSIEPEFEPVFITVSPTGTLNLYPFGQEIFVSGKSLQDTEDLIKRELSSFLDIGRINLQFIRHSLLKIHVLGSVLIPGTYYSGGIINLYEAIVLSGGFTTNASKQITVLRKNEQLKFDLNEYFLTADISSNPDIMDDDVIIVSNAKNYVTVFTNSDSLYSVQSVELKEQHSTVADVIKLLPFKDNVSTYEHYTLERDNDMLYVGNDFSLKHGDKLYLNTHEEDVFVIGNVNNPGKYKFNGLTDAEYYIALSGGWTNNGSSKKIFLINKNGEKTKYTGQTIKPGDVIYVPESFRSVLISYLVPLSTIISVISTIILISR